MELKKKMQSILKELKKLGWERRQIEAELKYSVRYLDQQLSKGANETVVSELEDFKNKVLEKATGRNPFPDDGLMEERAMIRVLAREIAEIRVIIDKKGDADEITKEYSKRAKAVLNAMKAF